MTSDTSHLHYQTYVMQLPQRQPRILMIAETPGKPCKLYSCDDSPTSIGIVFIARTLGLKQLPCVGGPAIYWKVIQTDRTSLQSCLA